MVYVSEKLFQISKLGVFQNYPAAESTLVHWRTFYETTRYPSELARPGHFLACEKKMGFLISYFCCCYSGWWWTRWWWLWGWRRCWWRPWRHRRGMLSHDAEKAKLPPPQWHTSKYEMKFKLIGCEQSLNPLTPSHPSIHPLIIPPDFFIEPV